MHDNEGPESNLEFGEMRSINVRQDSQLPDATYGGWVELYWHDNGWLKAGRSLMFVFVDRGYDGTGKDNWEDLYKHDSGFANNACAVRWNLSDSSLALLCDKPNWEPPCLVISNEGAQFFDSEGCGDLLGIGKGPGTVRYIPDLHLDPYDFNDKISSVYIWGQPAVLNYEVCDGRDTDCDGHIPWDERNDSDGDYTMDCLDNCPYVINVDQTNSDTDKLGDAVIIARMMTTPIRQTATRMLSATPVIIALMLTILIRLIATKMGLAISAIFALMTPKMIGKATAYVVILTTAAMSAMQTRRTSMKMGRATPAIRTMPWLMPGLTRSSNVPARTARPLP